MTGPSTTQRLTYEVVFEHCGHVWQPFRSVCDQCGQIELPTPSGKLGVQWVKPVTEELMSRVEWEASIRRGDINTLANIAQAMQREVYITTCTTHSGGPASPHNEDCFVSVVAVGEDKT